MTDTQKWQLLVVTVLLAGLVYVLAPVLTPFVFSALLAYLADPLVDRLERYMSRTWAVTLVFVGMTLAVVLVLLLLVPLLERQIAHLIEQLPRYLAWFRDRAVPWLAGRLGVETGSLLEFDTGQIATLLQENWRAAGGFAATVVAAVSKSGFAIIGWLINLLMVPVVTFYLLRDWDVMVERIRQLLPRTVEPTVSRLARESDQVLAAFLRGQLSVMIALGTVYTVGLWLVGIDFALLIGMIAGMVSFVPYLGVAVGLVAGLIAAVVQHGDIVHIALVCLVFVVGQVLEGMVLTPWLVGDRIGLHPVAVIFAVLAGGYLFGFLGILLALPVASVLMVVLRHLHQRYLHSHLYGAEMPLSATAVDIPVARAKLDAVPTAESAAAAASAPANPSPVSLTDATAPPDRTP